MFKMLLSKGVRLGLAAAFGFLLLSAFSGAAYANNTYTVTSTGEPVDVNSKCDPDPTLKPCTLREAINAANKDPNSTISFNITGPKTIQPKSPLPWITVPVIIDGTTQPGFDKNTNAPIIELDGSQAGPGNGLTLLGGGSRVQGLVINRFIAANAVPPCAGGGTGNGILINTNGGNTIWGNYIGTDVTGTNALGNSCNGISIFGGTPGHVIGGGTPDLRNVISGNGQLGISIISDGNYVYGNFIGTNAGGTAALSNSGGGVGIASSNNTVGAPTGTSPGGSCTGPCNLISGNGTGSLVGVRGVSIFGTFVTGNQVRGNFIGTDVTGKKPIGNNIGLLVQGYDNIIGGTTPESRNLISGNNYYAGIDVESPDGANAQVPGNKGNIIEGNFIGTDTTGQAPLGNCQLSSVNCRAVLVHGLGNTIGGTVGTTPGGPCSGACNLISGNKGNGVEISGGDLGQDQANLVLGNLIGTQIGGKSALGNTGNGVVLEFGARKNRIGGGDPGAPNVIAYNALDGVLVDDQYGYGSTINNSITRNSIFSNGLLEAHPETPDSGWERMRGNRN